MSEINLEKIVRESVKIFSPKKILIFGSYARGDFQEESDLNILIILKKEINPRERMQKSTELASHFENMCITPLAYTEKEIKKLEKMGHPIATDFTKDGKIIYEER